MHEGCLSVRWKVGDVERHTSVTVEAYDEHGNKFTQSGDKLLAHIMQHEIDHLDGCLYVDRMDSKTLTTEQNFMRFSAC